MELRTKADRIYIMMDRKTEDCALVKTAGALNKEGRLIIFIPAPR